MEVAGVAELTRIDDPRRKEREDRVPIDEIGLYAAGATMPAINTVIAATSIDIRIFLPVMTAVTGDLQLSCQALPAPSVVQFAYSSSVISRRAHSRSPITSSTSISVVQVSISSASASASCNSMPATSARTRGR